MWAVKYCSQLDKKQKITIIKFGLFYSTEQDEMTLLALNLK